MGGKERVLGATDNLDQTFNMTGMNTYIELSIKLLTKGNPPTYIDPHAK